MLTYISYKSLKYDLSQRCRGIHILLRRGVVIVVVVIIIIIHRFQGVKLEYVVIDSLKIVTVLY